MRLSHKDVIKFLLRFVFTFPKRAPAVKLSNTDKGDQASLFMASLHSQFWKCELNTRQYTNIPLPLQTVHAQGSAKPIQRWNCTRVLGKVREAMAHTGIAFRTFVPRTWKKNLSGKFCKGTFPHQNLLPFFLFVWGVLGGRGLLFVFFFCTEHI